MGAHDVAQRRGPCGRLGFMIKENPMRRFISASAVAVVIALPAIVQIRGLGQTSDGPDPHRALVTTYCTGCHNARLKTGGLALDGLDLAAPVNDAQIWEKALRKLRGHQMRSE